MAAPLFSSLPRLLCFTTSKVFSISLSLKDTTLQELINDTQNNPLQLCLRQLHLLACLYMFGGGEQRGELSITEDLRRTLAGTSLGSGHPSPWRAIYTRRL